MFGIIWLTHPRDKGCMGHPDVKGEVFSPTLRGGRGSLDPPLESGKVFGIIILTPLGGKAPSDKPWDLPWFTPPGGRGGPGSKTGPSGPKIPGTPKTSETGMGIKVRGGGGVSSPLGEVMHDKYSPYISKEGVPDFSEAV